MHNTELEDISENWLYNNSHLPQIPANVIAHHLAEVVNEQIENFRNQQEQTSWFLKYVTS